MLLNYLNPVGNRIARPDRPNCEIVSSDGKSSCTPLEAASTLDIVRGAFCTTLVPVLTLESRELPTMRM
jgi:hypothetical protein